ncbi:hypothetical protein V6N12_053593 [Hibiscus sabdariffa]|uniref:RNase H type-1 domain-containing protein n=1 Tax=Hibiscus sabdariffa TaxID=183260 RepID=A0ABR2D825_9ROSI
MYTFVMHAWGIFVLPHIETCITRISILCKAKWSWAGVSISDVLLCPSSLRSLKVDRKVAGPSLWVIPSAESLKFNGAIVGGFGKIGIGGILRNSKNESIILFFRSVGSIDATSAELIAILEIVTLFKKSKWAQSFKLLLETDCFLCVLRLERPSLAPLCFKPFIEACLKECDGLVWSIEAVPRAANTTADKLAKSGISRVAPLVWSLPN